MVCISKVKTLEELKKHDANWVGGKTIPVQKIEEMHHCSFIDENFDQETNVYYVDDMCKDCLRYLKQSAMKIKMPAQ